MKTVATLIMVLMITGSVNTVFARPSGVSPEDVTWNKDPKKQAANLAALLKAKKESDKQVRLLLSKDYLTVSMANLLFSVGVISDFYGSGRVAALTFVNFWPLHKSENIFKLIEAELIKQGMKEIAYIIKTEQDYVYLVNDKCNNTVSLKKTVKEQNATIAAAQKSITTRQAGFIKKIMTISVKANKAMEALTLKNKSSPLYIIDQQQTIIREKIADFPEVIAEMEYLGDQAFSLAESMSNGIKDYSMWDIQNAYNQSGFHWNIWNDNSANSSLYRDDVALLNPKFDVDYYLSIGGFGSEEEGSGSSVGGSLYKLSCSVDNGKGGGDLINTLTNSPAMPSGISSGATPVK